MSDFPINESSNASSSSSSPEGGLRVVNPDVKVSTVEDFKKVLIGSIFSIPPIFMYATKLYLLNSETC